MMRLIVTCGPGSEPIDDVRRITNISTGNLGVFLTNHLVRKGHEVHCVISSYSTVSTKIKTPHIHHFSSNETLCKVLKSLSGRFSIQGVLHLAALGDYVPAGIRDNRGKLLKKHKIPSNYPTLTLTLKKAPKVISRLSEWFPKAKIIGWKYELEGTPQEAIEKAFRQIKSNRTCGCVLNGSAIAPTPYMLCLPDGTFSPIDSREKLARQLNLILTH